MNVQRREVNASVSKASLYIRSSEYMPSGSISVFSMVEIRSTNSSSLKSLLYQRIYPGPIKMQGHCVDK